MKLKKGIRVPEFLNAIRDCRADILYVTENGDRINLNSTLSQFVFTAISSEESLQRGNVIISDPKDIALLSEFLEAE